MISPYGGRSDAQGFGHVAARGSVHGDYAISAHLPRRFIEMADAAEGESPIYLFEIAVFLAACLVYFRSGGKARTCVLRVNNKAALAALVKGSPSSLFGSILANVFLSLAARLRNSIAVRVREHQSQRGRPSFEGMRCPGGKCAHSHIRRNSAYVLESILVAERSP